MAKTALFHCGHAQHSLRRSTMFSKSKHVSLKRLETVVTLTLLNLKTRV